MYQKLENLTNEEKKNVIREERNAQNMHLWSVRTFGPVISGLAMFHLHHTCRLVDLHQISKRHAGHMLNRSEKVIVLDEHSREILPLPVVVSTPAHVHRQLSALPTEYGIHPPLAAHLRGRGCIRM